MNRATVCHIVDDTCIDVVIETTGSVNAKIHKDGRGYVKTPEQIRLFRRVEWIDIVFGAEDGG